MNTREIYDYNLRRNQLGLGWSFRIPYVDTDNSQIYYHDGEGGNYELRQTNESGAGGYSLLNLKDYQKETLKYIILRRIKNSMLSVRIIHENTILCVILGRVTTESCTKK